jgi:hypothetical protein
VPLKIVCVQVIVHDRETADGDGGDLREFLASVFDPLFTVSRSFTKQEGASYVAGHAVVPAGYGGFTRCARAIVIRLSGPSGPAPAKDPPRRWRPAFRFLLVGLRVRPG